MKKKLKNLRSVIESCYSNNYKIADDEILIMEDSIRGFETEKYLFFMFCRVSRDGNLNYLEIFNKKSGQVEETMEGGVNLKKFTIKEVSERLNLSQHTLRYYEKIEMIKMDRRGSSNIREYREKDIELLEYIKALKGIGFSLEDIKIYILLKKNDKSTLSDRRKILEEQHIKITEQIDFLVHIRSTIEKKMSCIDNREENDEN